MTGCVDGTLIRIDKPGLNTAAYICRKGYAAINVQCICGPDNKIYQTFVRWPGSIGDARMFTASGVEQLYRDGKMFIGLLESGHPNLCAD